MPVYFDRINFTVVDKYRQSVEGVNVEEIKVKAGELSEITLIFYEVITIDDVFELELRRKLEKLTGIVRYGFIEEAPALYLNGERYTLISLSAHTETQEISTRGIRDRILVPGLISFEAVTLMELWRPNIETYS